MTLLSRGILKTISENAGTPALFADMPHDDVTLDHGDTVKGQEAHTPNIYFRSDSKKVSVEPQPPCKDVEEGGKEVDIEHIFLPEEKHEIISRKIENIERSLVARQQILMDVSMRMMVCLRL
jgi:hypothetical protein